MIIYILHILCATIYLVQFPQNICLLSIFYITMCIPPVHRKTIYYLTEFKIPPWFIFFKFLVHVSLFINYIQKLHITMLWMLIYLWNDLYFVICHAEKRLTKIDELMYGNDKRIAHLYLNMYNDDIKNRFHKHLFDTNRLYMFEKTDDSEKLSLAIHACRKHAPEDPDKNTLKAATGESIFISNRSIIYVPALFIFMISGFISFEYSYLSIINQLLIMSELCLLTLKLKHFYILSNCLIFFCVCFANLNDPVYIIRPIKA